MKVILLQDVSRIGQRFAIKEVPDGHALNKLIPQGLAKLATPENLKRAKLEQSKAEAKRVAGDVVFAEALDVLGDCTITLEVEANQQGHLFKAVSADDIVTAVKEEGVTLSQNQVLIEKPIKELGEHTVTIRSGKQSGSIELEVVGAIRSKRD